MGILANRPILRRTAELAIQAAQEALQRRRAGAAPLTPAERTAAVDRTATALATDPVVVNQTNSEPWYRSRVYVGIATVLVGQVIAWLELEADEVLISEIVTAVGGIIALIGRSVSNAGPIVWWKPWTIIGIGR